MGGLGKTQLSLTYARENKDRYTSVFWINAKDELSLRQSLSALANVIGTNATTTAIDTNEEQIKVELIRRWLSEEWNNRWLLIIDNYDDPNLPNNRSTTGFDIRSYFPRRAHGHILITTRSPKLTFSKRLMLQKLDDINSSISVLSQRSGRDLTTGLYANTYAAAVTHRSLDLHAQQLAVRLDGLPLALAIAGVYLGQTNISCLEYLQAYETAWADLHGPDSEELLEYENRTMSSTWVISFDQVCKLDADAGEVLLWAYFSNRDVWYELIRGGASGLAWIDRVTSNKIRFDRAMAKLRDYSLVEFTAGSYGIHPCVHTWISEHFEPDLTAFLAASKCIMASMSDAISIEYWAVTQRLLPHINRLNENCYRTFWETSASDENMLSFSNAMAVLLTKSNYLAQAEEVFSRALTVHEEKFGPNHILTLHVVYNLGILYTRHQKPEQTVELFKRALTGYENAMGSDHMWTLNAAGNLGNAYIDQGKLKEAEEIHVPALKRNMAVLGPAHTLTLNTITSVGTLYYKQGRLKDAEEMYLRALSGTESLPGPDRYVTLNTTIHLGALYLDQKRMEQAEEMYSRTLTGKEALFGRNHIHTLNAVNTLGNMYRDQGKLDEAERNYVRVLLNCTGTEDLGRWFETFESLATILYKNTKAQVCGLQDAKRRFARLVRHFEYSDRKLRFHLRYLLARALLWIEDDEDFPIAFSQVESAWCDGRDKEINTARGHHVCLSCEDTDLCNQCMVDYNSEILKLTGRDCSGHQFVDVGSMVSKSVTKMNTAEEDVWIDKLKQKYPIIPDDFECIDA